VDPVHDHIKAAIGEILDACDCILGDEPGRKLTPQEDQVWKQLGLALRHLGESRVALFYDPEYDPFSR
jgi:hypothetical protein